MEPAYFLLVSLAAWTFWLHQRVRRQSPQLARLEDEQRRLKARFDALERRPPAPPSDTEVAPPPVIAKTPAQRMATPPATERPRPALAANIEPPTAGPGELEPPAVATPAYSSLREHAPLRAAHVPPAAPVDWERFVGVKLFAWLGGLALFFAAALALRYSFEHDLVPPALRAAGGFLLGAGLIAGGSRISRKAYPVTAQTLCATGVVILYAVCFACRAVYHFPAFGPTTGFLAMAAVTVAAFALAVWTDGQVVAVLGMLGGLLTPVLLSSGEDRTFALFGYVALLDAGLLGLVRRKRWDYLAILAAAGTACLQIAWCARFYGPERIFAAQAVFLGFVLLFGAVFVWAAREGWLSDATAIAPLVLAAVAFAVSFPIVWGGGLALHPGRAFTLSFGVDLAVLAMVAVRPKFRRLETAAGGLMFVQLAGWSVAVLGPQTMPWALGLYVAYGVLHTLFPVVLRRLHRDATPPYGAWASTAPALSLALALAPICRDLAVPWLLWPVVLALDAGAVLVAFVSGGALGLLAAFAFTFISLGAWMLHPGALPIDSATIAILTGVFGVVCFSASAWVWSRRARVGAQDGGRHAPGGEVLNWDLYTPALSAMMPLALLVMLVEQLRPANPGPVFAVALLLAALLVGFGRVSRNGFLLGSALVGALWVQAAWSGLMFSTDRQISALAWHLVFYAAFSLSPFLVARGWGQSAAPWRVGALAGPAHFALVYWLARRCGPMQAPGLIPAAFAALAGGLVFGTCRSVAKEAPFRLEAVAWQAGVLLFFVTAIAPIQLSREWLTIGWALEGAALCWLFRRVPHPGLRWVALGLLAVVFGRLALNPAVLEYHARSGSPVFNWLLYTYGAAIACHFVAARLMGEPRDPVLGWKAPAALQALGTILAFLLLNLEIADYFGSGPVLTFEFSGNLARDMAYTVGWSFFAFGLLMVGIRRRAAAVRYAGLSLLGAALVKLFFHDLAALGQLYRIGAFAVVAVVAIVASFLYQRFLGNRPGPDSASTPPAT